MFRPADQQIRSQKQLERSTCVRRGPIFLFLVRPADPQMRHQKRLEQSTSARRENRRGDIEAGVKNQRNAAAGLKGERADRDSTSKDPALILTSSRRIAYRRHGET